jgi:hypothetical protein
MGWTKPDPSAEGEADSSVEPDFDVGWARGECSVRRKPDEPLLMRLGRSLFECFENDPTEVELVFVEFCPIDDRVVRRAAELLGPQAVADRIPDADEAIPGKRVFPSGGEMLSIPEPRCALGASRGGTLRVRSRSPRQRSRRSDCAHSGYRRRVLRRAIATVRIRRSRRPSCGRLRSSA